MFSWTTSRLLTLRRSTPPPTGKSGRGYCRSTAWRFLPGMSPRSSGSMASLPREARADRYRRAWSRRRSRQRWKQPLRPPCGTSICFDKLMPAASAGTTKKDRSGHCARSGPTGKPSPLAGLSRQTRRHRPMNCAALFSTKTIYIRIVPKLLTNTWFCAIIVSN